MESRTLCQPNDQLSVYLKIGIPLYLKWRTGVHADAGMPLCPSFYPINMGYRLISVLGASEVQPFDIRRAANSDVP